MRYHLRRAVFSYSLASLYVLNGFLRFPTYRSSYDAYSSPLSLELMYAAVLDVLLLALALFGVVSWIASWGDSRVRLRRAIDGVFVFSMIIPAHHWFWLFARPKLPEQTAVSLWIAIRRGMVAAGGAGLG